MAIPVGYRQVALELQEQIERGKYPPGTQIPTYAELAYTYNISATTVQRVILILKERGLIVGVPGQGNYVVEGVGSAPSRASLKPGQRPVAELPPGRQGARATGRAAKRR